ncbi:Pup--protein ligase [Corynebacterium heidelbergense]|uniref:Pup--protein ligase n=1 Tax=Corynebacterium heidelbergense TaxID=2055947 RepID=A0A364V9N2_9CORY|nr:Pup--protein ligase [Corynebacterium heidelbergense]RAV33383.1 Pup--protein ligase [Corynebacterium heidelbergense]
MGLETEYGVANVRDAVRRLGPDEVARQLFAPVVEEFRSSNIYTTNGSRLYLDVGAHPEVATAECDSLHQLVTYDRAGDAEVQALAEAAEASLASGGQVHVFKNNTDFVGNSYGCHENYLVGREMPLRALSAQLLPFLVTRQLICGAGKVSVPQPGAPNENFGPGFVMSQRADHVWEGVSSATTRSRPIINTRDEPHADSSRYRRLHIIVGDSNMSEVTTALKVGATLLVLEMIEAGVALPDFEMANEIRSIRDIARDITGTAPLRLRRSGAFTTALEVQETLVDAADRWLAVRPEPERGPSDWLGTPREQLRPVVDLWRKVVDCFHTQDFSPVDQHIDWVIKRKLIERLAARDGLSITSPKLAQVDLMYHEINPRRGLFHRLQQRGLAADLLRPEDIAMARSTPPQTTRAALRGAFLSAARAGGREVTVDWMRMKINGESPLEVVLPDPFAAHNETVDRMVALLSEGTA